MAITRANTSEQTQDEITTKMDELNVDTSSESRVPTTGQRSGRYNNVNNRFQNNTLQCVEPRDWEGTKKELGVILTLRSEKLKNKVTYDVFTDRLATYIVTDVEGGNLLVKAITHHTNPLRDFTEPEDLNGEDAKSFVKREMKKREISKYLEDINTVTTGLSKVYNLVWGQTTSALQAVIKSVEDYEEKSLAYDPIWLLQTLKRLIAGVDKKGNKQANLFDALYLFMTMKQGVEESCDSFQRRQMNAFQTLEIAGGRKILSNTKIIDAVDVDNPTET